MISGDHIREMSAVRWKVPERIGRLDELASNLWWSWHPRGRQVFRAMDYVLWRVGGHNPVRQLREISPERLQRVAVNGEFLQLYDSVMAEFDADMTTKDTWFDVNYPGLLGGPVAYFSMEFAIHNSLPIYAGGLGVLAGDTCKEVSDLGLPFVGVGFMYPQGYFHQRISSAGAQEEMYKQLDFDEAPVSPVLDADGRRLVVKVGLQEGSISVAVWQVRVGRVSVYLLDTNVEDNSPEERWLSSRLYVSDQEVRLQQEIVLGMGGVRALRAMGIKPAIWHINEGHTAFLVLERIREWMEQGVTFTEAARQVASTAVFTTHTPIAAGHDVFHVGLVEKYLDPYCRSLGIDHKELLALGQQFGPQDQGFNMAVLALRTSNHRYGVSRQHGSVARSMWGSSLWPGAEESDVPIGHITNGVHVPTWLAPEMHAVFRKYIADDWLERQDEGGLWARVYDIPDGELWRVRRLLRHKLMGAILEAAQRSWAKGEVESRHLVAIGALLHPDLLTVGFVKRFAEYKRPTLIFQDIERLKRLVNDPLRPVQIIFAGKSHPADLASKHLVQRVFNLAADRDFRGRIAFVEDYDMHLAHFLVQGVDVWLNNPRRLLEACGTSGMKASINGVLHLSVRDGWWDEGYNGSNGWAIGPSLKPAAWEEEDRLDADAIYTILERDIVPMFYTRDEKGVPVHWVRMAKEAIRSVMPDFCARRMKKEYCERVLGPAAQQSKH
jgi:starch phosphorylase